MGWRLVLELLALTPETSKTNGEFDAMTIIMLCVCYFLRVFCRRTLWYALDSIDPFSYAKVYTE